MKLWFLLVFLFSQIAAAQNNDGVSVLQVRKMIDDSLASKWYEKILIKGYA